MTLVRAMFVAAFMVLTVGSYGVHKVVAPFFSGLGGKAQPPPVNPTAARTPQTVVALVRRARAQATSTPTSTAAAKPTATAPTTTTPTISATATTTTAHKRRIVRRRHIAHKRPAATPTPRPSPTATATSGLVTLDRYWIGSQHAALGTTFSVGYVIDNGTGHTQRIMLGASIKGARVLSWLTGSVADRLHDVVAIVPPGVSTHSRYFTVPARLRPGAYDVAWGLRNASTGRRDALVFADSVLRVTR